MNFYPYATPIILTDDLYSEYGGSLDGTTQSQRNVAYVMAEEAVSRDINTLLAPTIVTGTFPFSWTVMLDYGYVHRIIQTEFIDFQENVYYTVTGTANVYIGLLSDEYGQVDMRYAVTNCQCSSSARPQPYKVRFVYEAGLMSGTSYLPHMLMALKTYSEIMVNEIIGYGNESTGDIGVQNFSNQEYREDRVGLIRTTFGTSAKAQFIHKLLAKFRKYRQVGL